MPRTIKKKEREFSYGEDTHIVCSVRGTADDAHAVLLRTAAKALSQPTFAGPIG
jgi:hypothetical protein